MCRGGFQLGANAPPPPSPPPPKLAPEKKWVPGLVSADPQRNDPPSPPAARGPPWGRSQIAPVVSRTASDAGFRSIRLDIYAFWHAACPRPDIVSPRCSAPNYTLNQRSELSVFADDQRVPIDNNASEREMTRAVFNNRKHSQLVGNDRSDPLKLRRDLQASRDKPAEVPDAGAGERAARGSG
jgi:hypothetical protein